MPLRWVLLSIALVAGCKSHKVATPPAPTVDGTRLWPARDVPGYDPHEQISLSTVNATPWSGEDLGSAHYRDVMMHTPVARRWSKEGATPTTIAHETHHGLQAAQSETRDGDARFFYFERGYGAFVPRAKQTLRFLRTDESGVNVYAEDAHTDTRAVRRHIPKRVKQIAALRYDLYLITPERERYGVLVLFNEWNAYIASARIAIELWDAGIYYRPQRDDGKTGTTHQVGELDGMVDFLYFASAGISALAEREPEYLESNPQLRAVFAVLSEETMRWLQRGRDIQMFRGFHAEELREHFATSTENRKIRAMLRDWLGPQWTARVLGF